MKKTVTLDPGQSKVVSFSYTPTKAKTYQVSVDGLSGAFIAYYAAANLSGRVTDAATGSPVAGATVLFDGQGTTTNDNGEYSLSLEARKISIAFSHVAYYPYQRELTLQPGENELNISLERAISGQVALKEGYNMVTYTGEEMTVYDALSSIAAYVRNVLRFHPDYYEDVWGNGLEYTKRMIPGEDYWIYVNQDCIWTF